MFNQLIKHWFPLAIAGTIAMFAIYAAVQQNYRQSANDPQISMAEDGAAALAASSTPIMVAGTAHVNMSKSLTPFTIVYDDSGKVLASSGYLAGEVPLLPAGVLDYTRANVSDRITWQPASTTRLAAIVRHYDGSSSGFIVVARNLRETEARVRQLTLMLGTALVALLILTLIISAYSAASDLRKKEIEDLLK